MQHKREKTVKKMISIKTFVQSFIPREAFPIQLNIICGSGDCPYIVDRPTWLILIQLISAPEKRTWWTKARIQKIIAPWRTLACNAGQPNVGQSLIRYSRFPNKLGRINRLSLLCLCPLMLFEHGVGEADNVVALVYLDHMEGMASAKGQRRQAQKQSTYVCEISAGTILVKLAICSIDNSCSSVDNSKSTMTSCQYAR